MKSFDYIIVGAGSAGCVLANRLSSDPAVNVLLLEAGGQDSHPLLQVPLACGLFFYNPAMIWGYETEPEPHADGRTIVTPAARLLGGGSSINGMLHTRGHRSDFDQWAQMGNAGWSYEEVLPYFRRSERSWRGESGLHGAQGPLSVEKSKPDALFGPIAETSRKLGYGVTPDFDGTTPEGLGLVDASTHRGRRGSTARRYWRPVARRANLQTLLGVQVNKVILEGIRAVGVEYVEHGVRKEARADREVILSAGAFGSPKILMLSGIGRPDDLQAAGIGTRHALPGVGQNLQDHPGVDIQFRAAEPPTPFEKRLRLDRLTLGMLRWAATGKGGPETVACSALGFLRSREGLACPDIEWVFFGAYADTRVWFPGWRAHGEGHIGLQTILLRPESRGAVRLRSGDPAEKLRIRLNIFATENDRQTVLRGIRMSREFMATDPARRLVKGEISPGADVRSDDDLLAYMRSRVYSNVHYVGTCKMGSDDQAVVDAQLRVRGIAGLRVVDASIMPTIVGAHTNAATIMIAEKAADLLRGASTATDAATPQVREPVFSARLRCDRPRRHAA